LNILLLDKIWYDLLIDLKQDEIVIQGWKKKFNEPADDYMTG
jgi:hypothetical protein